ncbi:TniQ family protein [Pseudomonas sp. MPB26]|uniref:TniQ family protein n=1 Tax=Pseudomonas sp. MPB26 TaxID=3388491 RepID=UPI003984DE54
MLLQIQPDESLISFVIRTIHINQYSPERSLLDDLSPRSSFDTKQLRKIAGLTGWRGCYGFNRLVHNHTLLAAKHVIKVDQDISYSGPLYASKASRLDMLSSAYCPDCVREDLESQGFSYWRRYTYPKVTVCHKHNTVLLERCHFCERPFSYKGHSLDVMWRGCKGRQLCEAPSTPNLDALALRRAVTFHRLCSTQKVISYLAAARALHDKAETVLPTMTGDVALQVLELRKKMGRILQPPEGSPTVRSPYIDSREIWGILEAIILVYESCDDFLVNAASYDRQMRTVDSLWNTYQAEERLYPHFVEEDYLSGIGHWSCPHPSPHSASAFTQAGFHTLRPLVYPCCNSAPINGRARRMKPEQVVPLPGIPRINTGTSSTRS